jgi:hypothetical protein
MHRSYLDQNNLEEHERPHRDPAPVLTENPRLPASALGSLACAA